LWAYSNTIGTIELSWDAAVGGDGEITYALFAEEGNVNFARKGLVEPPQATFNSTTFRAVLTNLTAGANYSLLVVAVDEEGDRSGNREPARVTVADVDPMLWPNNTLVKFSDATTLRSDSEEQVTLTTRELPLPDEFKVDAYFLAPLVDGDVSYVQILSINVTSEEPLFVAVLAVRKANFTEVRSAPPPHARARHGRDRVCCAPHVRRGRCGKSTALTPRSTRRCSSKRVPMAVRTQAWR